MQDVLPMCQDKFGHVSWNRLGLHCAYIKFRIFLVLCPYFNIKILSQFGLIVTDIYKDNEDNC